jgi:hypothetical protein
MSLFLFMDDPQSRIEAARASGKPLHVETTAPLTDEDRQILNSSRSGQIFMYVVFIVLLTAFPFLPFEDAVLEYQVGASVALFILITWLVTAVVRKMNKAHRTIPKKILRGIVTNKAMESGKKATHYELTVGDSTPLEVTAGQYHSYQVGDGVEIHYWTGWGIFVLRVKRWEG